MITNSKWVEKALPYILERINHIFDIQTNMMVYLDSCGYEHRDEETAIDIAVIKKLTEGTKNIRTEDGKIKKILKNSEKLNDML